MEPTKWRINCEGGRTRIFVDDTEITQVVSINFYHEAGSLPELKFEVFPTNLEMTGDGATRFYADDDSVKRYIDGTVGYREEEDSHGEDE